MPYTKIHPINATIEKAIAYICDPNKTDNGRYIHAENCSADTAAVQFEFTKKFHHTKNKVLGFHIIQSFRHGEVTAQQALEISYETMKRFVGDRYEFIVAVHNDRDHIHSHIIINSVNMINGRAFSTEHDKKFNPAWKQLRKISDEIAKEKGISTIENPLNMSRSYYEWEQNRTGVSWKEKLKRIIDSTVQTADNFDDFLRKLQSENITVKYRDYVKKSGKCLGYKMDGQKYFVYTEKFGWYYSIENLQKRIERSVARRSMSSFQKRFNRIMYGSGKLKKLHDLSEFDSESLRRWGQDENRKIIMQTLSEMKESGFDSAEEFLDYCIEVNGKISKLQYEADKIDSSITEMGKVKMQLEIYNKYKLNYDTYQNSFNKERYFRRHEKEILLFMQASTELEKYGEVNPAELESKLASCQSELQSRLDKISELKELLKKLDTIRYNLEKMYERQPEETEHTDRSDNEPKKKTSKSKNNVSLD